MLPWIVYTYQLHCFIFAAGTLGHVYSILFHHKLLHRYFYQAFMQRQFHFFEYFIDAPVAISVTEVPIGSYFGKPSRKNMLFKTTDKFLGAKRHLLLCVMVSIIFILKCYRIIEIIYTIYSMIADGN